MAHLILTHSDYVMNYPIFMLSQNSHTATSFKKKILPICFVEKKKTEKPKFSFSKNFHFPIFSSGCLITDKKKLRSFPIFYMISFFLII